MSFRIEEKIVLTTNELFRLCERLRYEGMRSLHPTRIIHSTYFDSRSNGMFTESEEGSLPRKKLRIRTYDQNDLIAHLETKISSVEGRFKTTNKITINHHNQLLKKGIVDSLYGLCRPKVEVSYSRKYFHFEGVRITFDTNIRYKKFNSAIFAMDSLNVMEIKASVGTHQDFLAKLCMEPRRRFSKFSRAVLMTGIA